MFGTVGLVVWKLLNTGFLGRLTFFSWLNDLPVYALSPLLRFLSLHVNCQINFFYRCSRFFQLFFLFLNLQTQIESNWLLSSRLWCLLGLRYFLNRLFKFFALLIVNFWLIHKSVAESVSLRWECASFRWSWGIDHLINQNVGIWLIQILKQVWIFFVVVSIHLNNQTVTCIFRKGVAVVGISNNYIIYSIPRILIFWKFWEIEPSNLHLVNFHWTSSFLNFGWACWLFNWTVSFLLLYHRHRLWLFNQNLRLVV